MSDLVKKDKVRLFTSSTSSRGSLKLKVNVTISPPHFVIFATYDKTRLEFLDSITLSPEIIVTFFYF